MSEIDWSKAPEWATVLLKNLYYTQTAWASSHADGAKAESIDPDGITFELVALAWHVAAKRPPPAWSAEGLPPVGCVCEANFTGEWVKFEMLYLGSAHVIFKTGFEVHRTRGDFDTCGVKFRPLRTAEQLAAEARLAEIERLCKVVMAHPAYEAHNRNLDCSAAMRLTVEAIVDNKAFAADA